MKCTLQLLIDIRVFGTDAVAYYDAALAANPALAQTVEWSRTGSGPLKTTKVEAMAS